MDLHVTRRPSQLHATYSTHSLPPSTHTPPSPSHLPPPLPNPQEFRSIFSDERPALAEIEIKVPAIYIVRIYYHYYCVFACIKVSAAALIRLPVLVRIQ